MEDFPAINIGFSIDFDHGIDLFLTLGRKTSFCDFLLGPQNVFESGMFLFPGLHHV